MSQKRECKKCRASFEPIAKAGAGYSYCRACRRRILKMYRDRNRPKLREANHWSRVWAYYKITKLQYEALLKKQGGKCAICGKKESNKRSKRLCIDHDHTTGEVRGLLCTRCNYVVGWMDENEGCFEKAIEYQRRNKQ